MRKITIFLLAVAFSISSNAGIIYVPANSTDNTKPGKTSTANVLGQLDANTFLSLTPAKVQEMTGKKMTFAQKIALKIAQKDLKKQLSTSKKLDTRDKSKMLRLWIIFALIALVASVLAYFIPFMWAVAGLAWLASLIFFVLWIIAVSA